MSMLRTVVRGSSVRRIEIRSRCARSLHVSSSNLGRDHYKLLIVGAGTGGCSMSNVFTPTLGKGNVAILDAQKTHYYQPGWTMVGGGMKPFEYSARDNSTVINKDAVWIQERAGKFEPDKNLVVSEQGTEIEYDYLVIAPGLQLRYDMIKGLPEAFDTPGVCSNYHRDYVKKTFPNLYQLESGNAVFTFPNTPIKCAGAPQKICYIADQYLRKQNRRDKVEIYYNTSLPVIFGIKKYAKVLMELVKKRNIHLNTRHNLCEVRPDTKEAIFEILDENGAVKDHKTFVYSFLHVAPPCSPIEALRNCPSLTDAKGWVSVNKDTLQHTKFDNIFAIGDCTNAPTAKTAAAVAAQTLIVKKNLNAVMKGKNPTRVYDGYTSCPLVTGYDKCILAEFDYNGNPLESFPWNQAKERWTSFYMKKEIMPRLYWSALVKGLWYGPGPFRNILRLGMKQKLD